MMGPLRRFSKSKDVTRGQKKAVKKGWNRKTPNPFTLMQAHLKIQGIAIKAV